MNVSHKFSQFFFPVKTAENLKVAVIIFLLGLMPNKITWTLSICGVYVFCYRIALPFHSLATVGW